MPLFVKKKIKQVTTKEVQLGGRPIAVKITLSKRRSYAIIVSPNLQVEVKAPLRSSESWLLARVYERELWILKHLEKFGKRPGAAKPKQYAEGEMFSYLGRQYKLRFVSEHAGNVRVNGEYLDIGLKNKTPAAARAALKFWYKQQAHEVFTTRLPACLEMAQNLKLPEFKMLNIKHMRGRWGSCSSRREITLNPELVAATPECIDYVIVHELCHLREHNHSPRFYRLMSMAMPDWKQRRRLLNSTTEVKFL